MDVHTPKTTKELPSELYLVAFAVIVLVVVVVGGGGGGGVAECCSAASCCGSVIPVVKREVLHCNSQLQR